MLTRQVFRRRRGGVGGCPTILPRVRRPAFIFRLKSTRWMWRWMWMCGAWQRGSDGCLPVAFLRLPASATAAAFAAAFARDPAVVAAALHREVWAARRLQMMYIAISSQAAAHRNRNRFTTKPVILDFNLLYSIWGAVVTT